jgi:hypothetical protein
MIIDMFEPKFVDYNGSTHHIGTEKDLYSIIEDGCGTDVADFVGILTEKANSYDLLKEENYELEDKLGGTEIELEELEDEYNELQERCRVFEDFYERVENFVNDNYIKTDKTIDDIFEELKKYIKEV